MRQVAPDGWLMSKDDDDWDVDVDGGGNVGSGDGHNCCKLPNWIAVRLRDDT